MFYFQASIDQFTVTNDPSDVSEQCSVTKTSLDDKVISHQEKQTISPKLIQKRVKEEGLYAEKTSLRRSPAIRHKI